jgi:hypothetical protein
MTAADLLHWTTQLDAAYGSTADPVFAEVIRRVALDPSDDEALAELIEVDGRARLRHGRQVSLDRYLAAVSDLPRRPEPLDAAIEMALRWLVPNCAGERDPIEVLIQDHPGLERAIREADALTNALWSTVRLERALSDAPPPRALPCDFGSPTLDGRPRFELLRQVGEGAFGQVYLAVDRQLSERDHQARVAIKISSGRARSQVEQQRLAEEATKARRIDHPNVVRVLDRGVTESGEDFIVHEFMEGGDLGRLLRRRGGALPPRAAASIAARIARGVHAAHMAGLVHCDLKPSNIMLTAEGEPKVADFGIAIRTSAAEASPAAEGAARPLGNLAFISPEQFRMEEGALTVPSDIYALGGVLYWMLTNRLPNGASAVEIRRTHDPLRGRLAPPAPGIDPDLDAICTRCMAVRPQERHASAAAVAEDLEAWLKREPIAWTRPSPGRRLHLWVRRRPGQAAWVGALLGIAAAGTAFAVRWGNERHLRREEERLRQSSIAHLDEAIQGLMEAHEAGAATELLPQIWLLEWVYGPTVLRRGVDWTELWRLRRDVIASLVQRRRAEGLHDDVQTLIWEGALGFWLITAGRCGEADAVLERNLALWRARLASPDDPLLADLELMRVCAAVGRTATAPAEAAPGDLIQIEARLQEARRRFERDSPEAPLRHLVLRSLVMLKGPSLLDDAAAAAEIQAELAELSAWEGEETEE